MAGIVTEWSYTTGGYSLINMDVGFDIDADRA